ncbi:hypothetical protein [Embleya scabrispora]|uniref:hypothetical protein n=1 Tax=Embleya scabrispora TaxID=159449 RepID=UPI0003AAA345|nr:hypothetical protein [Embleya scabrispora]MYS78966.1 hypothetical protein [Streptomyces sp. SID5474]
MSGADVVTGALCMALTGLGLVIAVQKVRQRRFLNATRWTAAALFPIGLYLTGLATLGRRVGSAAADWATDLAFGIKAWGGVAILAFAVMLLMITRMISRKNPESTGTAASSSADLSALMGGTGAGGSTGGAEGALPRSRQPKPAPAPRSRRAARGAVDDEFAEIEELLRKRGI